MTKPPYFHWIIGALGVVWFGMGCLNYIAQTSADAVAQMPELLQLIINTRPAWATAGFGVAVFGGAVGCILLLLRRSVAVPVFVLAVLGHVLMLVDMSLRTPPDPGVVLSALIAGALGWYASIAKRKMWLA